MVIEPLEGERELRNRALTVKMKRVGNDGKSAGRERNG
jgi:hypothetical protein